MIELKYRNDNTLWYRYKIVDDDLPTSWSNWKQVKYDNSEKQLPKPFWKRICSWLCFPSCRRR
jgi:hypothetical protein